MQQLYDLCRSQPQLGRCICLSLAPPVRGGGGAVEGEPGVLLAVASRFYKGEFVEFVACCTRREGFAKGSSDPDPF